jgi:hypothetical protein
MSLPPAVQDHFFDRLQDREIAVEDFYQLATASTQRLSSYRGSPRKA